MVRITAVENHQWKGLLSALNHPEWAQGLDEREARIDNATMINQHVTAWTATRDKAACTALLQANGVPSTPVNVPAELLTSAQYIHRGTLTESQLGGKSVTVVGNPWVTQPGGTTDPRRTGRLADLRVTELTHVLAGPIIGALLGAMGARVVRIEESDRLDIYRRTGPFVSGQPGVERGAYFAVANHSKDSVLVEPARASQSVSAMLGESDVLIENVGGSRLKRLGVVPERLAETGRLTIRVSGFGSSGPLAGYRVYANNVQSYGGLAGLTADTDGAPAKFGTVIADPLSSVVAAIVIAAWAIGSARDLGAVIDLSMAEVVTSTIAEFVSAASVEKFSSTPDSALHRGVYRSADGRWVAVEVLGAAEWERVAGLLGEQRTPCPDAIAATIATAAADAIADRFAAAGVRAAVAVRAEDLIGDAHLTARDFFPEIVHPDPDIGTARLVGMPWRFVGHGAIPLRPPPALGSANARYERTTNV
jgi:crotonobetainyl-CoA:carnitine CoA-transferase CaiB-like acyl-CoA transferase